MITRTPCSLSPLLRCLALSVAVLAAACSTVPPAPPMAAPTPASVPTPMLGDQTTPRGLEIALYAFGLIDTGYRFGGKNPEAGLDCSGMVSYIYDRSAGLQLRGSAADIARRGRQIERGELRPGDLVFFNTRNQPFSHVGIYIGDERFVHAPSTNGKVRIDRLRNRYYAERFQAARTYFD